MKNQFGRSMIEMLGVLAIIGVLSIGGVATFKYAMTKDKANKLIYDINLLREQTLTNAADVPAENFEPESGYQMSSQYGEGGIVSIMIDDLDKDVCERLLSMRFEDLRFLHTEQNTDILSCEGTPSFRAVFGLGDNAIIDEDACVIPCDSNHECHERRCCPKLTEGQCSATASGCPTQVADDGTPCGTNQVCDDGECVCGLECEGEFVPNSACDACECGLGCANGGTVNESCTACENCDNSYGGTYCEVCNQDCQNSGTPIQNCSACDCANSWEGDNCETCGLDCQNGGTPNEDCSACDCPSNRTGDNCETCAGNWTGDNCDVCELSEEDCPIGFKINQDTCSYECSLTIDDCGSSQNIDSEHCLCVCENEGYTGYSCSYSCPNKGACVSGISKSACEACGNAFWTEGACCHCNRSVGVLFNTEAEAKECMNACAGTGYERYQYGKYCYHSTNTACPPATSSRGNMSKSVCEACGDAFWYNGTCYGCGYSSTVSFDTEAEAEECEAACAGRGYERYQDGVFCRLPTNTTCPSATSSTSNMSKSACEACGNTFWGDGDCYGCGYSSMVSFDTEAEAKACMNACVGSGYERYQSGVFCYLANNTTCPSVTSRTYDMSKSACEACGNTFWGDGDCYGCGYSGGISFDTEAEAAECENICAGSGYNRIAEGTYCHIPTNTTCPSATSRTSNMSKSMCEACGNAFWNKGTCYGCGYSSMVSFDTEADAEACANQCTGSGYERNAYKNHCSKPTCPSATSSTSNMSKSACEVCTANDGIQRIWSDATCYGCGYSSGVSFDTTEDAMECMNTCASSGYERYQSGTGCYRPSYQSCPSLTKKVSNMSKSACEACGNTFWNDGDCYGCGYSSMVSFDTEAEAEECENACVGSSYERARDGAYCYLSPRTTCPSVTLPTQNMSKSACEACGNTFWNDGTCYGCGYSYDISFVTEAEAKACMNACVGTGYERYQSGKRCYRAPNTTCPSATSHTSNMSKSTCDACTANDGIQRIWSDGVCLGCGDSRTASFNNEAEAEACVAACADTRYPREIDKSGDVYYCDLK